MIFSMSMVLCPTHNYFDVSSTFDFSTFSVLVVTNAICTLHHSAMYRLGSSKAFHWLCKVLKIKPKTNLTLHRIEATLCTSFPPSKTILYYILTSSVIYYRTDSPQHGIHLFYTMIRKERGPIHISLPASYHLTVQGFVLV